MALTERTEEDKIEVVGAFKHVHVRTATIVERSGKEISRTYHRHVLAPDANITNQSAEVQAICNASWTQAVKDAYTAHLASLENNL